jgi:flagellar protein FliO/FliZ
MNAFGVHIISALAVLAAILALIWLAARGARQLCLVTRAGRSRRLVLAETLPLDARRRVHLIRCDGHEFLLLTGGASDAVIGWVRPGQEP